MTKLIVSTEYGDLVRFLFTNLREERDGIPMRDNFFLIKNLSHTDIRMLDRYNNFVIVSKAYATETWGRQEIFDFCSKRINSRRKPTFERISDKEFEKNIKVFLLTGKWFTEDEDSSIFELYANLDNSSKRLQEYFKLRDSGLEAQHIFYSVLTFCGRVLEGNLQNVSKGYMAKIQSKKTTISRNFSGAISNVSLYDGDLDDSKVIKFLMDIGKVW